MLLHPYSLRSVALVVALGLALGATGCAAGIAVRTAAAGASRGALARGAAARAVTVPAQTVGARSILRQTMVELTAKGTSRAVVTIDRTGAIKHAGRRLARLKSSGDIVVGEGFSSSGRVVGRITDGRIWEVTASGHALQPIGRVLASVRGRPTAVLTRPANNAPTVGYLRSGVTAELIQVRDAWYQVRLLNDRVGWIWAPFATIATLLTLTDDDPDEPSFARITLADGYVLTLRESKSGDTSMHGIDSNGQITIIDSELVEWVDPAREELEADTSGINDIRLIDGSTIVGGYCEPGLRSVIELNTRGRWSYGPEYQKRIVLDEQLVATDCS